MNTHVYMCMCVYICIYIHTHTQNRQTQGCEVNECLSLESTKPKSMLNKVQSVYSDFLDNLCVSVACEPAALFSCDYTLNGSLSAHVTHAFGAGAALSR